MTTALPTADAFLTGGSSSAKFEHVGDTITGMICEPPIVQQQTDFTTGAPQFWPDGNAKVQLAITLQTEDRDASETDDDGRRRLYVKNQMRQAVVEALRKTGAKTLEVGGTLTITYTADGVAKQRGFNPPKQYQASYIPATAGEQAAFLGEPAQASQPAVAAVPATNAPAAQFTPEQLAAMKAAGVDVSQFGG